MDYKSEVLFWLETKRKTADTETIWSTKYVKPKAVEKLLGWI